MKKIKIKKLYTACVMTVFETDDKGNALDTLTNKQVNPDEAVYITEETKASLDHIHEAYEVIDSKPAGTTAPKVNP